MIDSLALTLSAREYARLAFGDLKAPEPLAMAIRGLHATAPSDSSDYRRWLREYVRTGFHPLDVLTYDIRQATWEEQLACRDLLVLAIRQGKLTPNLLRILNTVATRYDRIVFNGAAGALVGWSNGDDALHPRQYRDVLLRMADGNAEDLP